MLVIRYEYIFGEVEQNYKTPLDSYDNSIKVDLHGITFLADYEINENWYATGGIGYHQGTKTTDLNGPVYRGVSIKKPSVETGKNDYDLDNGISVRGGIGYKRSFAENWDFNAQLDYLYIELDDEQQGNIYSKGFAYTAGLTYHF
jgi:long-subunit fatty acid transport protein